MTRAQKDLLMFIAERLRDQLVADNSGWLKAINELMHNAYTEEVYNDLSSS